MIEAKELTKVFPGIVAVENVSFQIGQGEIVGFLGPNGAGKTTSMRILSCFLPPTSGSATVAGFDCLSNSQKVRERIGYLPERNPHPKFTIRINPKIIFGGQFSRAR